MSNGFIRRPRVGLALGGGGARGLAHIGVIKVLKEANVPIDFIVGTSMGGVVGGLFASGMSLDELEHEAIQLTRPSQMIRLMDISLPKRGLVSENRLRPYLQRLLKREIDIETLSPPLAVVTVDLKSQKEIVLRKGPLIDAMMATSAVPGIFPPVDIEMHSLVDGGVLNNVPADIARRMGAEMIIAVDVNQPSSEATTWDYSVSHLKQPLWLPTFALDFYNAQLIMVSELTRRKLQESRPEVVISPNIPPEVNIFLGFPYAAQIIRSGKLAAEKTLPIIEQLLKPRIRWPNR